MGYSNWSSTRTISTKVEYGFNGAEVARQDGPLGINSRFGYSVAVNAAGDTVVVGAPYYNSNAGAVIVYKNIAGSWTRLGQIIYGSANSWFGCSVDINAAGDMAAIGAPGYATYTGYVKIYN